MQHNILCFILDTPHWGRYFHDCISGTIVSNSNQATPVPYPLNRSRSRAAGLPAGTEAEADPFARTRNHRTTGATAAPASTRRPRIQDHGFSINGVEAPR